ncbi:AraC family transcriptional regulator [Paenibacillus spongiae]|uniref:AraC family transcriptional regulator n=1 Tax=Paenibacillus spongiae TaxID=2909671 RepID=A0ABY5SDE2_9BACL|nr:AraC family transcriptional regulator [Paenibacillus spongiae]UVI31971.1 AraC family transcriptional regulator [Paenibacillus spongiae]
MLLNQVTIPFETVASAAAGSIVYPPGGRFGPRIQQDVQLVMLYTGEMIVTIDGQELRVQPGHVVLLKPGHEESFIFSRTEETWHRWIAVHAPALASSVMESLYALPPYLPLTEEMNRLTDLMLHLQRQAMPADPVLRSLGLTALHLYPTESTKAFLQKEKHPAIYAALAWMHEHYAEDVTLKEIADHACLSSEHLVRLFKQFEQTTPIHYLWQYRVERSIELLTNTGLNVTEIAHRCGFKTSHHLARLIKQSTGRTASEIRQLSWSGLRKA